MHHSAIATGDMHEGVMGTAIDLCLGVMTAVGVAVAAIAFGCGRLWRCTDAPLLLARALKLGAPRPAFEARAGPLGQPLLSVWRR